MNRKDYFNNFKWAMFGLTLIGTLSLFNNEGASDAWKVFIPSFFYGIVLCITIYGFIKYKK